MPTHILAAAGVTENDKGEILLVKTQHGGWVFPGGQVEEGENVIDAVIRETIEESGIIVVVQTLFVISSNTGKNLWYDGITEVPTKLMLDFICKPVGGTLQTSEETSEVGWYPKEKVLDMITAPAIIERFKAYLEFDGNVKYLEYVTSPKFDLKFERLI
jgi:8-oxo-dGTP pyrophosphatase MutT (NUDIX family)